MKEEMARAAPCVLSTDSPDVRWTFEPSSANFCRMSFSRRPSCGASTVIKRPLMPRFSACWTILRVISRSLFTYSCINCTCPGLAASTISSNEHDASVGIIYRGAVSVLVRRPWQGNGVPSIST